MEEVLWYLVDVDGSDSLHPPVEQIISVVIIYLADEQVVIASRLFENSVGVRVGAPRYVCIAFEEGSCSCPCFENVVAEYRGICEVPHGSDISLHSCEGSCSRLCGGCLRKCSECAPYEASPLAEEG